MQERKIPTIVGLLLVGAAVFLFRIVFDRVGPLLTQASATVTPKHVTVTNISANSFTVTWTTAEPATGLVRIDGKLPDSVFFDERVSRSGTPADPKLHAYRTHSVTVRNLKPETPYHFHILSNGTSFRDNGKPYETRTAPAITGLGNGLEPAYGQVTLPSGSPAEDAIVQLTLEGGQVLSTLSKASGTWVIPLNLTRTENLSGYLPAAERINASLTIQTANGDASALIDTMNDNPVPVMTIGKTYDFRKIQANTDTSQNLASSQPNVLGTTIQVPQTISIVRPAQGSAIPSNLPLFQGTGIAGTQILITIGINYPVSDTVMVGSDGIWRYTPIKPLQEGKQSVTITATDAKNKTVALTNTFEILKSGTQVLGDATPSATLTPTPTEIIVVSTDSSTLAGQPIPTTGFPLPLLILLTLGIGVLSSGFLLFIR